jgi:hypothetical protein
MSKSKKFSSIALATTAALMFSTAPLMSAQASDAAKVKCEGANACKGQSQCGTASSTCKGQNACKGKGFTMVTKAECDAAKPKKSS